MEDGTISWSGKTQEFKSRFQEAHGLGLLDHYLHPNHEKKAASLINVDSQESNGIDSKPSNEDISLAFRNDPVTVVEQERRVQGAVNPMIYWYYQCHFIFSYRLLSI